MSEKKLLSDLDRIVLTIMIQESYGGDDGRKRVIIAPNQALKRVQESMPEINRVKVSASLRSLIKHVYISKLYDEANRSVFEIHDKDPDALFIRSFVRKDYSYKP